MKRRVLKYGAASSGALLVKNAAHVRAHRHAFLIYGSNAVYSMIPKNACSTMRLSIAIANGAIRDASQAEWIHHNNQTFNPALAELMRADYTFVILRCPLARLASCYLDKFVGGGPEKILYKKSRGGGQPMGQLTFRSFCASLADPEIANLDHHWAAQSGMLIYDEYDDYFAVEQFAAAAGRIQGRAGLDIVDARGITGHGMDGFDLRPAGEAHCDTPLRQLVAMRAANELPDPRSLYDAGLIAAVSQIYAEDMALFQHKFPGQGLFERKRQ